MTLNMSDICPVDIVYRVELPLNNKGPYWNEFPFRRRLFAEHCSDEVGHPCIKKDIEDLDYDTVCGFDSIDKLYEWFRGFEDDLNVYGFKIATYIAVKWSIVKGKSGRQLVFPMNSTLISYQDISLPAIE